MFKINLAYFNDEPLSIPEEAKLLVGREEECRFLEVSMGQGNFLIRAPRGYGKTTMLYWAKNFPYRNFITIEVKEKITTESKFYSTVISGIIKEIKNNKIFYNVSKMTLGYITGTEKNLLRNKGHIPLFALTDAYDTILDSLLNDGVKTPIYLFMDETNYLARESLYIFRDFLKSILSTDKRVKLFITMQTRNIAKLENLDKALLDRFQDISLKTLSAKESEELLRKRLEASRGNYEGSNEWYPFTKDAIDYIVEQSVGVPRNLVKNAGVTIWTALTKNIDKIDLNFTKKVLREREGDIYSINLRDLGSWAVLIHKFLQERGCARLKEIAENLHISRQLALYWIRRMKDEYVIEGKNKGEYCIAERKDYE